MKTDAEDVTPIVNAASFLQVTEVLKICSEVISTTINVNNAVEYHKFAFDRQLVLLLDFTRKYIGWNFARLLSAGKLNALNYTQFAEVIESSELSVDCEFEVFAAVSQWVACSLRERKHLMRELLERVRLPLLTPAQLNEVRRNSVVKSCQDCLSHVTNSAVDERENRYASHDHFDLLVFGGFQNFSTTSSVCKLKCPGFVETEDVCSVDEFTQFLCATTIGSDIYFFAGENYCAQFYLFSTETGNVKKLSALKNKKYPFSICSHMGKIYALGGVSDKKISSACHAYDPHTDKWKQIASMKSARRNVTSVVFGGKIHVIGGKGENGEVVNVVERYDSFKDCWSYGPSLNNATDCAAAVVVRSKLYVLGMHKRKGWSFEVYDESSNEFAHVSLEPREISFERLSDRVVAVGDKIVIVGGYYDTPCGLVHIYDTTTGLWSSRRHSMERYRCGFTVFKTLKNGL